MRSRPSPGGSRGLRASIAALSLGALSSACARPPAPAPVPGVPALGAPRVVPGALEARPLLEELPERATKLGAGPLAIVTSGMLSEGERSGAFVEVPRDHCLLTYARGSSSLEDVDLAVFAEDGDPLAVDEGPDPKPTVLLCPPRPGASGEVKTLPSRVYVAVHAAGGQGLAVVGAQLVPVVRAGEVGPALAVRGATNNTTAEGWPGLEAYLRAHRSALGGTWQELRRVAAPADARVPSVVAFNIDEGGCTDAIVVPGPELSALDVEVMDGDGRLVARARETAQLRTVTVCSSRAINGTLQVRPHAGRGAVAVVLSTIDPRSVRDLSQTPEIVWAATTSPLEAARGARVAALAKAGYAAQTSSVSGQLQAGRRQTIPLTLTAPSCTRIDVVAGAPLTLVDAALWDDAGAMLAADEGVDGAVLFACAPGRARLDLSTRGRPGPFTATVRPERWSDPAFRAHPLAASRMLARAAIAAHRLPEGASGPVRAASLEQGRQLAENVTVRVGECVSVVLGAEGEGTGIELRAYDVTDGEELDRSHGAHAGAVRVCASEATRTVRVETRVTSGKLDVVLGERRVGSAR